MRVVGRFISSEMATKRKTVNFAYIYIYITISKEIHFSPSEKNWRINWLETFDITLKNIKLSEQNLEFFGRRVMRVYWKISQPDQNKFWCFIICSEFWKGIGLRTFQCLLQKMFHFFILILYPLYISLGLFSVIPDKIQKVDYLGEKSFIWFGFKQKKLKI